MIIPPHRLILSCLEKNSMPKPTATISMAALETLNATICAVIVVPIFAPMMTPMDCAMDISPAVTKPTTSTIVTDEN